MTDAAPEHARPGGTFLVVLVFVAFGLRAGVVGWLSDTVPYTDFALYHVAGAEIARDPGFLLDAEAARRLPQLNWWPPGYPIFLGSVYALFGAHHRNAVWIQVLLGVATCVLVYGFARRIADERIARMAAILVALNPTYIFLTNQLASENLYVFWFALGLWAVGEWHQRSAREHDPGGVPASAADVAPRRALRRAFGSGVVLGLGALTRAVGLVVPFVVALWMWRSTRATRNIGWLFFGVAVALVPWSVRNGIVVGRPAVVSFGGGLNFYFGHNEDHIGYQDVATSALASIRDPVELDRTGYRLGLEFMAEHPLRDLQNSVRKIGAFFAFPDYALHVNSGVLVPDVRLHPERAAEARRALERQRQRDRWLHGTWSIVARTYYVLLLVAAVLALARWRTAPPGVHLAAWLALAWTLVHVAYWAQPRFRAPVEILLAVLAGFASLQLLGLRRRARGSTSSIVS